LNPPPAFFCSVNHVTIGPAYFKRFITIWASSAYAAVSILSAWPPVFQWRVIVAAKREHTKMIFAIILCGNAGFRKILSGIAVFRLPNATSLPPPPNHIRTTWSKNLFCILLQMWKIAKSYGSSQQSFSKLCGFDIFEAKFKVFLYQEEPGFENDILTSFNQNSFVIHRVLTDKSQNLMWNCPWILHGRVSLKGAVSLPASYIAFSVSLSLALCLCGLLARASAYVEIAMV